MLKIYEGKIKSDGTKNIFVNGKPLNPRLDLWNHSPDGFNWGYHGFGPSQAALAILADYINDDKLAVEYYQRFKDDVIAKLDKLKKFILTDGDISRWYLMLEDENK